jgi:hypothetical protein
MLATTCHNHAFSGERAHGDEEPRLRDAVAWARLDQLLDQNLTIARFCSFFVAKAEEEKGPHLRGLFMVELAGF